MCNIPFDQGFLNITISDNECMINCAFSQSDKSYQSLAKELGIVRVQYWQVIIMTQYL